MDRYLLTLTILFLCFKSYSQFNDSTHYFVSYTTTGVINRTNESSSYVLSNGLRFSVKKKSITLNNNTSWLYGQQQQKLSNNDFINTLDFNLYRTLPHFYYWGLGNYESSYSLRINNRYQAGLGAAYSIIDRERAFLNVSNGLLYEGSDIVINDSTNQKYNTFRNSFRLRFRFAIQDLVILESTSFHQQSLSRKSDYILRSVTSLSVKLRKWLSLTAAGNYNRVNRTNRENLLLTYGLRAETYF